MLERELEAMDFTCGAELQNFCDSDSDSVLDLVHTRADLCCQDLVEIPYFSSGSFPRICIHCAGNDLVSGEESVGVYPTCNSCFQSKPKVLQRKRKIFAPKKA